MSPDRSSSKPFQTGSEPLTEYFHRLNSVLPDDQQVVTIPPDVPVTEALEKLKTHHFSQLPVVVGREVLGLFSYRSFSNAVVTLGRSTPTSQRFDPLSLLVEDCLEKPTYARVTDEFTEWFDSIDRFDAVLVGEQNRLLGIVTAMDILRYLYGVASPFVLLAEIELALRALIRLAVNDETLADCARTCLKDKYGEQIPTLPEDMSFNDYVQLIGDGRNWPHFQRFMGGDRNRTRTKLEQIRDIRNVVFHFKRGISAEEYDTLAAGREWMLLKARAAEARQTEDKR